MENFDSAVENLLVRLRRDVALILCGVKELLKRSVTEGNPNKLTRVDLQSDELLTAGSGVKKIGTRQAAEGRKGNGHRVAQ